MLRILRKAGFTACFFLLVNSRLLAIDKIWQFNPELQKAYQSVLNLQPEQALEQASKITSKADELHKIYVLSLLETAEALVTEDPKKYEQLDNDFKQRLDYIESLPSTAETLFLEAELNLQRGFNQLNTNQEFSAVFSIKRAYNITQECLKKYPDFIPIKKTSGVMQVMIGSVPDKYHWFMNLLGMKGSVAVGQKQLLELKNSKSSLSQEATILLYTIRGFINQQFNEASKGFLDMLKEQPDNRLILFLGVNMLVKDSQGEKALELIEAIDKQTKGLQIYYLEYLKGEMLLEKGEYAKAIPAYQKFIKTYKSQSFKKDSYYKMALCYWLVNDVTNANANIEKAKVTGKEQADPDKYAAKQLEEPGFPNQKLLKSRFYTDGGYYKEATATLASVQASELKSLKDRTEFYYRKARLAHKMGEIPTAKMFYQQSIDLAKENPWYFGANSALQLGYIFQEQKDYTSARKYFELAMTYKKHEYKSSIDTKARLALEQLKSAKA